eukprot:TRINITY_DN26414_c0_g1_i1.p1 TRINITY_DN26414_c0_g1~~TRINITY_DN26414_c0_g1_i1.p1  ORF type:complete len:205 (-),score=35.83 TRINITY_DN26414_c0_g1_i1:83-676(-)
MAQVVGQQPFVSNHLVCRAEGALAWQQDMVKILASGEIVQDSDPRAKAAATQRRPASQGEAAGSSSSSSSRPAASSSSASSGAGVHSLPQEENVIAGDLARAIGVHGKTQHIMGHDIPLVYLIVAGGLALLWISGNMNAIRMIVFGFVLYVMYTQYQKSQREGGGGGLGGFGLGGGGGGAPSDNSSGGHVINRGQPR